MHVILPKSNLKSSLLRGLISEFIGTMFLSITITVVVNQPSTLPALTIGMMLLTQVFAYGYIGGGMFNPAVSTGVFLTMYRRAVVAGDPQGKKHFLKWVANILSQHAGAFIGANLSAGILSQAARDSFHAPMAGTDVSLGRAFAAELLFTCSLVSVMLNTAMARRYESSPNSFYGIGIGMSVFVGVSCVADISGGAFNPAVATALQLCRVIYTGESDAMRQCWLYWLAGILAGCIAAVVFTLISDDESEPVTEEDTLKGLISGESHRNMNDATLHGTDSTRQSQQGGKGYYQLQAEKAENKRQKRQQDGHHDEVPYGAVITE